MNINTREQITVVSRILELTTNELHVIKDKWEELKTLSNKHKMKYSKDNQELLDCINAFDVFFTPILADVPSTEEIYNDLFTEEEVIPNMACAVATPSKRDNFTALVKAEQARNTYKHVTEDN